MDIILKEDILNLGFANDIVSVRNGYARNYLIPRKLAVSATESNRKILAETIKQRSRKLEQIKKQADLLAGQLKELNLQIKMKSSEEGTIYGSVTNILIAEALKIQHNVDIDRKKINIPGGHIKELGQHKVTIPLHKDVIVELNVLVVAE
jgi:large subunit ribosomal protein L9